jgi:translation initiation factor 3 subunit L
VTSLLSRAVRLTETYAPSGSIHYLIGYFSIIELSRVECLVCDYSSSYKTASALTGGGAAAASSGQSPALYSTVFQSHLNLFYHTGISLLMLRRYSEVIELYSTITLHMTRLQKPAAGGGNAKSSPYNQFQKVGDKILSLTALAVALSPDTPLDDHVADLVASKLGDKFRRLKTGDLNVYREIFESAVPKFVSPTVSSSTSITSNDIRHTQTELFLADVRQEVDLISTRNYLRLYTTVPISKLAHFTNSTEEQTLSRLLALANKTQNQQSSADASALKFTIQGTEVIVESGGGKGVTGQAVERYFTNGIRRNAELLSETEKIFRKLDL